MKHFTESDISRPESDFPHIYLGEYRDNLADCPLWWHTQGLSQTATGYGAKLTSRYKIHFEGKLYRLYTICFSNAGTTYFTVKGRRIYVS